MPPPMLLRCRRFPGTLELRDTSSDRPTGQQRVSSRHHRGRQITGLLPPCVSATVCGISRSARHAVPRTRVRTHVREPDPPPSASPDKPLRFRRPARYFPLAVYRTETPGSAALLKPDLRITRFATALRRHPTKAPAAAPLLNHEPRPGPES